MARVLQTPLARGDLKEIGRYIARETKSRDVAFRFLKLMADKCALYATQPEMGERCPDLGEGIRRFTVGNYVVFYPPLADGIEVLRVIHGGRDIPTAWRDRFR